MHHCSYPADSVRKLHQVSVGTDLFNSVLCWFTVSSIDELTVKITDVGVLSHWM